MPTIVESDTFQSWISGLKDREGRARIIDRIQRLAVSEIFGDARAVGDGVSELRFHFGPGYRVYFIRRGETLVILLCAGDKSTQERDIKRAKKLAEDWS